MGAVAVRGRVELPQQQRVGLLGHDQRPPRVVGTTSFSGNSSVFSGTIHSNSLMTNAIYDFTFGWPITPHIGAGVGASERQLWRLAG